MPRTFDLLMRRAKPYQESPDGVSMEDFARIPASEEIGQEILDGFSHNDPGDRRISLFFCDGFLRQGKLELLGERLTKALPEKLSRLIKDPDESVRDCAIVLFALMRDQFSDYRATMLGALTDHSSSVRTVALNVAETFLKPREIEPLLSFEHDPYLSEVGGMGGPVHYVLRDQALATIERMVGQQFAKHELTEMMEGEVVFWWDWAPMLKWYRTSGSGLWVKFLNRINVNRTSQPKHGEDQRAKE